MPEPVSSLQEILQRKNLLFDFYAELLTEKQRAFFMRHYMDDMSLTEIGEHYGVTPQAAADLLKRTGALLDGYEKKLKLLEKHELQCTTLRLIHKSLDELTRADNRERIASVKKLVDTLIM